MPLKIIYGVAGTGKTHRCLNEMAEFCKSEPLGAPLYLIVPEQASFEAEKQLSALCGGGFMRAQVSGFKRFALRIMNECGRNGLALSDVARLLIVKRLLQKNAAHLKVYRNVSAERNFVAELVTLFRELKNSGIAPTEFINGKFAEAQDKLGDLALLYAEWEQFKAEKGFLDPEDYLNELPPLVGTAQSLRGARFWLDGFNFFSKTELNLIASLLNAGYEVTVSLCIDDLTVDYSEVSELFNQQWQTVRQLRECTEEVACEYLGKPWRFKHPGLIDAGRVLRDLPPAKQDHTAIELVKAANPAEEAAWIVREINRLVRGGAIRYREIAVAGRSIEEYRGVLESAFKDAGIVYAFDQPAVVSRHMLTDFIRALLEIRLHKRDYRSMFTALKTGLFDSADATAEEFDQLENYVLKFGIHGNTWIQTAPWGFAAAEAGFTGRLATFDDERMDQLRRYINEILEPFMEHREGVLTVNDYISRIETVLAALGIERRLVELAAVTAEQSNLGSSSIHAKVWEYTCELFAELKAVCGRDKIRLEDFAALLSEGFEGLQIKTTPPGLDYVTVCSLDRMKMPERTALFIFGLNEGVIPVRGSGNMLLGDADFAAMSQAGLAISVNARSKLFADKFVLYAALSQAKLRLYLSCALAGNNGKARTASLFFDKISRALNKPPRLVASYLSERARTPREQVIIMDYLTGLRGIEKVFSTIYASRLDGAADLPYWRAVQQRLIAEGNNLIHRAGEVATKQLQRQTARELYIKEGELVCSISKLEAFAGCPFKFFANYGLRLREREVQELDLLDVGNIYHAVLQKLGQRLAVLSDAQLADFCRQEFDQLKQRIKNQLFAKAAYNENLAARLYRRFEKAVLRFAAFSRTNKLKPELFEQAFGKNMDWQPVVLPGAEQIIIEGKIDRIDRGAIAGKDYALLVDYKNSRNEADITKIYHGLSLQLPVYLAALRRNLRAVEIAGLLYLGMKDDRVSTDIAGNDKTTAKKRFEKTSFTGIVSDSGVIEQMGEQPGDREQHIMLRKNACDSGGFELLSQNALACAGDYCADIIDGVINAAPARVGSSTACSFCEFLAVCHFEPRLGGKLRDFGNIDMTTALEQLRHKQYGSGEVSDE